MPDTHDILIAKLASHSPLSAEDQAALKALPHRSRELAPDEDLIRQGEKPALRTEKTRVLIDRMSQSWDDFQTWCREVVWWGNKKGAYLHAPRAAEITPELAGHY